MHKKTIFLFFLIFFALIFINAIYMHKDNHGHIIYTDTPMPNSQIVNVPETLYSHPPETKPETVSNNPVAATQAMIIKEQGTRIDYTLFSIITPKDQETIQNQPIIPVEVDLKPSLQAGDRVQLLLDSKTWGTPVASTHLQMNLVDRGTHQLAAIIVDSNGTIVKETPSITIFVHRASAALRPV